MPTTLSRSGWCPSHRPAAIARPSSTSRRRFFSPTSASVSRCRMLIQATPSSWAVAPKMQAWCLPLPSVPRRRKEGHRPRSDATSSVTFRDQTALSFSSPSGTINSVDGPIAVLYFRLASNTQPGQRFDLVLDPTRTNLVDGEGRPLAVDPRPGGWRSAPGHALRAASPERPGAAGRVALLVVEDERARGARRGRVDLPWDPPLVTGLPQVRMDPRSEIGRAHV